MRSSASASSMPASTRPRAQTAPRLVDKVLQVESAPIVPLKPMCSDQMIGHLLAKAPADADGTWPCRPVCEGLEWMASPEVARGFNVATRNARGAHWRGDGGDQEGEIAARYRGWAEKLAYEYPYVGSVLESIAASYDHEAKWNDSDSKVRSRLPY